jgi:exonuclease SbcC
VIKGLTIQNFLSHKKTSIAFSPGVNIIVGPTDSGKSAIIKALKWLVTNRPLGDSFKSYWGGLTSVGATFTEGEVKRIRGDKENAYHVKQLGDTIEFNAVKGDVPQEVAKVLDLGELNVQTQFASHFLLSQSPGEVAQYFNKVAHLDKIDTASQNIRRWLKDVQSKLYHKEEDLRDLEKQIKEYEDLDLMLERIVEVETLEKELKEMTSNVEELEGLITKLQKATDALNEYSFLLELETMVNDILKLSSEVKHLKSEREELELSIHYIIQNERKLQTATLECKQLEEKFHKELGKGKVCPLCDSIIN